MNTDVILPLRVTPHVHELGNKISITLDIKADFDSIYEALKVEVTLPTPTTTAGVLVGRLLLRMLRDMGGRRARRRARPSTSQAAMLWCGRCTTCRARRAPSSRHALR